MINFQFAFFRKMLNNFFLSVSTVAIAQLGILAQPSFAAPVQLKLEVYPLLNQNTTNPFQSCPTSISLNETSRPYTEGSYATDGSASLGWLAKAFKIEKSDHFSVTWVAKLQPKYRQCLASAKISQVNDEAFERHSYLRMQFANGNAYLILDMTGMRDANKFTTVILNQAVKNGNPVWSWGGSD
ncbi:hypothetical protein HCU40_00565 [Pseudanabaena biceps]|nr:hypothetical protein [Pseudanabaena biceps]